MPETPVINQMGCKLLYYTIWIRDVFWLGPLGPGTKGAWVLYAQDKCPIMNQHPLRLV